MNYILPDEFRVLALDPSSRGIGYAVLEGPERLLDWGVKDGREEKNAQCLSAVAELIDRYRPQALAIEDPTSRGSRRCRRVRELLEEIRGLARARRIPVTALSRARVFRAFAPKKDVIAAAIAGRFPELASRLPPPRTLTRSEDYEMSVFDAAAFAQTFFYFRNRKQLSEERKVFKSLSV